MEIGAKRRLERKARPRSGTLKSFAPGSAGPTGIGTGITTIMVAVGTRTIGVTTDIAVGIIAVTATVTATVTVPGIGANIAASGGRVSGRSSSSDARRRSGASQHWSIVGCASSCGGRAA